MYNGSVFAPIELALRIRTARLPSAVMPTQAPGTLLASALTIASSPAWSRSSLVTVVELGGGAAAVWSVMSVRGGGFPDAHPMQSADEVTQSAAKRGINDAI
jgi:hypothetical protein